MKNNKFNAIALAAMLAFAAQGAAAADTPEMTKKAAIEAAAAASASVATPDAGKDKAISADSKAGADLAKGDRTFVTKAAQSGMLEVELGKLAQDKASHPAVKEYASLMVKDHGKANEELMKLVSAKGIELDRELDKSHRRDVEKMAKSSAEGFDRMYMNKMLAAHKKDVKLFEKASKSLKDPELKAFAESKLPTLKHHLEMAQRTSGALKRSNS
ncbi:DUF4142 domain-containing protein [Piscinibacter sakaiensis]|uniref:DUF4142 domain-containing protein n=1 Tax=Piscinibacter sakaiensis TaxID=1547922 RepID=UPI003AAF7FB2